MIPFDFKYYKAETVDEAINTYHQLITSGMKPLYYSGGTEIVTFARKGTIEFDALIDINNLPQFNEIIDEGDLLTIGGGMSLNSIIEANPIPMISSVLKPIADHTVRNKLTLGGNICGRLPYREGILPFLVADAKVIIAGKEGIKETSIHTIFDKRLLLKEGDLLLQMKINKKYAHLVYRNVRRVKQLEVDYPLFHTLMMVDGNHIRAAFSGICSYPFASDEINNILNQKVSVEKKVQWILEALPSSIKDDHLASKDYREFLFAASLKEMLTGIGGNNYENI